MTSRPHVPPAIRAVLAVLVVPLIATQVVAADRPIELIPTVGWRGGAEMHGDIPGTPPAEADASGAFGVTVDFGLQPDTWFEVLLERQTLEFSADPAVFGLARFDVDVDYLHFGASYSPARDGVRPYVTVAVGLTHFNADAPSSDDSTDFSGSLGGGFQVPIGKRVGLRFEVRGYATLSGGDVAVACGAGCVAHFGGSGWYQVGGRVGLAIRL
jgi:hypothetical protein